MLDGIVPTSVQAWQAQLRADVPMATLAVADALTREACRLRLYLGPVLGGVVMRHSLSLFVTLSKR